MKEGGLVALFQWDESFSVGVRQFDAQHQKLVDMLNSLHDASQEGRSREVLGRIFHDLIEYTVTHFQAEERLMAASGFPGYAEHRMEHERLTARAVQLQEEFRKGKINVDLDVLNFLVAWLGGHIKGTDREYGPYLNDRGIT